MTDEGTERGRGILTAADRQYLDHPDKFSRQAASQREEAIKNRIRNAVLDFHLLATEVDRRRYHDLLRADRPPLETDDGDAVAGTDILDEGLHVPFGVAFLLRLSLAEQTGAGIRPRPADRVETALEPFAWDIEWGIQQFLQHHHAITAEIEVSIEANEVIHRDQLAEELAARAEPVSGRVAVDMAARLGRAGFSRAEINELLGFEPTAESVFAHDPEESADEENPEE